MLGNDDLEISTGTVSQESRSAIWRFNFFKLTTFITLLVPLPRFTELKSLSRRTSSTVIICDWNDKVRAPDLYFQSVQRRIRNPEWANRKIVVVKRIALAASSVNANQSCSEADVLRDIGSHPNIVALFDTGIDAALGCVYLVFEHMEGTLAQLIKSRKQRVMPEMLVRSILRDVARGSEHLASRGYAHCSLSPDHILVTTIGLADYAPTGPPNRPRRDVVVEIKITGMGHARSVTAGHAMPNLDGQSKAIWYHSPELVCGLDKISAAQDMWSLGAISYELATLKPVFPSTTPKDVFLRWCSVLGPPTSDAPEADSPEEHAQYAPDIVRWAQKRRLSFESVRLSCVCSVYCLYLVQFPITQLFSGSFTGFSGEFLNMTCRMLAWNPDARPSASQIIQVLLEEHSSVIDSAQEDPVSQEPSSSQPVQPRPITAPPATHSLEPAVAEPNSSALQRTVSVAEASETRSLAPSYRSRFLPWRSTSRLSRLPDYDNIFDPGHIGDLFARTLNSDTIVNASMQELCSYINQLPASVQEQDHVVELVRRKESSGVEAEYLIVQCALVDKGTVWIRLERLERDVPTRSLSRNIGSKANDMVRPIVLPFTLY